MGRLKKAGKSGTAAAYYTRGQAIRKLQVSLKDFRRLCILKGIYPRDPRKKANGKDKTYYHKKDIAFLLHEPLLHKFREMKIFLRQKKRLKMRHEDGLVEALEKRKPVLNLDHLVKERYPAFVDALRDMDDALTLVHLFAQLPSGLTKYHKSSTAEQCLQIAREFQSIVAHEHCLRKVFVSVKGIYYQAEVQGELVTWTVPHKFAQQCPTDVDYRVMLTFLDFYLTLLRFVNFKLYHDSELVYAPKTDSEKVAKGRMVSAVTIDKVEKSEDEKLDAEFIKSVSETDDSTNRTPFKDLVFLLSRETPCDSLEFVILSGGGRVYHEDEYTDELAEAITHQVVDRPALRSPAIPFREYIQPQWVYDSFNAGALLPIHPYGVGQKLPPHLSPFVDDAAEGYIPAQRKVIEAWTQNQSIMDAIEECEEEDSDAEVTKSKTDAAPVHNEPAPMTEEEEEKELAKIMMTNKKKRLYSKMQYGINEKKKKVAVLEAKRKKLSKKSNN